MKRLLSLTLSLIFFCLVKTEVRSQTVIFESSLIKAVPNKPDTLKAEENPEGDLTLKITVKASDIEDPLNITISSDDHHGAVKDKDYKLDLAPDGKYKLERSNSFKASFPLTILANAFPEEVEFFTLKATYKKRDGKDSLKILVVEITNLNNTGSAVATAETEKPAAKDEIIRHTVFNDRITCSENNPMELTLTALEKGKKIQEMEITWSARGKEDSSVIFNLAGNKTHFSNKAAELAKGIKGSDCDDEAFRSSVENAYDVAVKKIEEIEKKIAENTEAGRLNKLRDSIIGIIQNRMDAVAEERDDAAKLVLERDYITIYKSTKKEGDKKYKFPDCNCGEQNQLQPGVESSDSNIEKLTIDSIVLKVFNNTVHQLDIVGNIDGNKIQTISNNNFGLPLRHLIDNPSSITFFYNGEKYQLCYCEIFHIRPTRQEAINYTILDSTYIIKPPGNKDSSVTLAQKRLLDFFSVSAFFDFLSLDENSANRNLFTEAYFRFNINNNAHGKYTLAKQLYATVNIAADLSGKNASAMPSAYQTNYAPGDSSIKSYQYFISNLDLYKYAFFQGRPMLNLLSTDWKKYNTIWELNGGFHVLGSSANTIDPDKGNDSVQVRNVYSWSPAFETRFRVTPKSNFGFDFHISYLPGFKPLTADFETLSGKQDIKYMYAQPDKQYGKTDMMIAELNFFFNPRLNKSSTNRGGFYFRMNLAKPTNYGMGHFMFLAGYSSDIKTFMR